MKHTKGKWTVNEMDIDSSGRGVYRIQTYIRPTTDDLISNALLISKCPEMLEALKKVYDGYGDPKIQDMVGSLLKSLEL